MFQELRYLIYNHTIHAFRTMFAVLTNEGPLTLFKKFFYYYIPPQLGTWIISNKTKSWNSVQELVDQTYETKIIAPGQVKSEITQFLQYSIKTKPKIILEIGTCRGGVLFLLSKIATKPKKIISIDLPYGNWGGGYHIWRKQMYQDFSEKKGDVILLREDSHKKETISMLKNILGNKKIDLLFIDGDHSYEGVKKDYENYQSLVKKGGIIALHDICKASTPNGCEVYKLWNELKKSHPNNREFIENKQQNWAGIGVINKL